MRIRRQLAPMLILVGFASGSAQAQPSGEIVLAMDRMVEARINGIATRIEVNPDQGETPIVNPEMVGVLGLKPSMIAGATYVGSRKIKGGSDLAKLAWGGQAGDRRVFWFDIPVVSGADGSIGPNGIGASIIKFVLREPVAGETPITLPIEDRGRAGLVASLKVGDEDIPLFFSLKRKETLVTAATGASLARHFGGSLSGPATDIVAEMGIVRPARPMQFATPVMLDRLQLTNIMVRTVDWGNADAIADGTQSEDPNEIIVTGKAGKKQRVMRRIYVGTDALANCSSLTYDRAALQIRLMCRPAP